ncbi:hypothetical protein MMC18_003446 [Xylographa bjoerkii]|nr:hypothetical protein [Xylographa bjoerkii]
MEADLDNGRRYLPEPFLWYLFHKLSKALVILQYGRVDPPEAVRDWVQKSEADSSSVHLRYNTMSRREMFEACKTRGVRTQAKATKDDLKRLLQVYESSQPQVRTGGAEIDAAASVRRELQTADWKEIGSVISSPESVAFSADRKLVHRDMSPNNIFFGEPEDGKWSMYPMPKLADFGMAIETYDGDPRNPAAYKSRAISRWMAPEQRRNMIVGKALTKIINAQMNVYQLGLIIAYAVGLDVSHIEQTKRNKLPTDAPYRMPLMSLLDRCLNTKPKLRPTPLGLYRITGDVLESCYTTINGDFERFRLYYRGNEINDMQTGFHVPPGEPEDLFLHGEQFPVADTMNNEDAHIRPPTVDRFYPYESDGRDFFEDDIGDFRKWTSAALHRMTFQTWDSDFFDSSDDSGPEAKAKYNAKIEKRKAERQAIESEYKYNDPVDTGNAPLWFPKFAGSSYGVVEE